MILREDDLVRWGRAVGAGVDTPVFISLRGALGAGKSVFARAVAVGAGVEGHVPSPTFNLLLRYEGDGGVNVVHMDLYRLDEPSELWELGWESLGTGQFELAPSGMPVGRRTVKENRIWISIA